MGLKDIYNLLFIILGNCVIIKTNGCTLRLHPLFFLTYAHSKEFVPVTSVCSHRGKRDGPVTCAFAHAQVLGDAFEHALRARVTDSPPVEGSLLPMTCNCLVYTFLPKRKMNPLLCVYSFIFPPIAVVFWVFLNQFHCLFPCLFPSFLGAGRLR